MHARGLIPDAASLLLIELNVQAFQELPVFVTDLVDPLLNWNIIKWQRFFRALGWFFLKGDGRFEHQENFIAGGTNAVERVVDGLRIINRTIDRFAQFLNQFLQVFVQTSSLADEWMLTAKGIIADLARHRASISLRRPLLRVIEFARV